MTGGRIMGPILSVGNQHNWVPLYAVCPQTHMAWKQMEGIRGLHPVAGLTRTLMGVFKASLDGTLSNLVQWSLTIDGGLEIGGL